MKVSGRFLGAIGAVVVAALGAWGGGPKVEWLETVHDFGAFREVDGVASTRFRFVNVGDEPLVVTGARANCGCTTPKFPTVAVAPGDTSWVEAAYDPDGRPGRFTKKVYVDMNTDPARSTLTIKGSVIGSPTSLSGRYPVDAGALRLANPAALLGVVSKGHVKSVFEGAYNVSTDTLSPVVKDQPEWLEVKTVPERVAPGEQVSFNFYVKADRIGSWDIVTDTVTIVTDPERGTTYRMPVVVTVNEDFSRLTDEQIAKAPVAGVTFSGGGSMLDLTMEPGTITISNTGKSPLTVRRVYSADKAIRFNGNIDGVTVKPGKKVAIGVEADCSGDTTAHRAVIMVVTNDPLNPKIRVPVVIR